MANDRIGEMSFCGVKIDNKTYDINAYKLLDVDKPASPSMTFREYIVPNKHGSKRYDNRYEDLPITIVIGVSGSSVEKQTKITALLQQWINREGQLSFSDRPNLFYIAKFFDMSTSDNEGLFTKLTIKFTASFCMYEFYDDLRDYTVNELAMTVDDMEMIFNRSKWDDLVTYQVKQINNTGNFGASPLIELTGSATLITIGILDKIFSFNNLLNETVFIDSENMVVYKMVGNKKTSAMQRFTGLFPIIPVGISDVTISGIAFNLSITIDFKNTYIV